MIPLLLYVIYYDILSEEAKLVAFVDDVALDIAGKYIDDISNTFYEKKSNIG